MWMTRNKSTHTNVRAMVSYIVIVGYGKRWDLLIVVLRKSNNTVDKKGD